MDDHETLDERCGYLLPLDLGKKGIGGGKMGGGASTYVASAQER